MAYRKTYKGRYRPRHPGKYKGDPANVIYRSLWERRFMVYCDSNSAILEWGSEEFIVPYKSPIDGKYHRYFPDFYIKYKDKDGKIRKLVIEIKPKKYTKPPIKNPKRKTQRWQNEVLNYVKNNAKWEAARKWSNKRGMDFTILTEDFLSPYK
jgi:hypothetical protein